MRVLLIILFLVTACSNNYYSPHKMLPADRLVIEEIPARFIAWVPEKHESIYPVIKSKKETRKNSFTTISLPKIQLRGTAKYYPTGRDGMYAAAGPPLRKALGKNWRGRKIYVCARKCIRVTLNDFCGCNTTEITSIDLSDEAFSKLAPFSRGEIKVTFRW